MKRREINTADLFCGAGGAMTGLTLAIQELGLAHRGFAVNHWNIAVATMQHNHPDIKTVQSTVEAIVPADAVPGGQLDLLWASPSCTHHSRAKGGRPLANQLRAQPELILTWLDQLFVRRLIVENVPEIIEWGPIGATGRPLDSMRGSCFNAWVNAIRARNYDVDWRVLNCADYGDATTRKRFFLQAVRRGCGEIAWPDPVCSETGDADLFGKLPKWKSVGECIDWSDLGTPVSARKRPLAENTMRRIEEGVRRFCGQRFVIDFFKNGVPTSPETPLGTLTTHSRYGVASPFVMDFLGTDQPEAPGRIIDTGSPLPTIHAGGGRFALATPFVMGKQSNPCMRRVDQPSPTITTGGSLLFCSPIAEDGRVVDVLFRMLRPDELAAAHSFPEGYKLTGNSTEQVRQVGNSVPVATAKALCMAALAQYGKAV